MADDFEFSQEYTVEHKKTPEQIELRKMVDSDFNIFITLGWPGTYRRDPLAVTPDVIEFFKHVESKCFGRKSKKISRLITLEYTEKDATHIHMVLKKPDDKSHEEFRKIVKNKWQKLKETGNRNMAEKSKYWFQEIRNTEDDLNAVTDYITKCVKSDYSTVLYGAM